MLSSFIRHSQESVRCPVKSCIHKKALNCSDGLLLLARTSLSISLQPFETLRYSGIMLGKHISKPLAASSSIFMRSHISVPECRANVCGLPLRSLCIMSRLPSCRKTGTVLRPCR